MAWALLILAAPGGNTPADAHPISLSAAVVDVRADTIRVDITIMLEDLVLYHSLRPDEQQRYSATDLLAASRKHREFLLKYFTVRDANGGLLRGKVVAADEKRIGKQGVAPSELMSKAIEFSLEFALPSPPRFLTFMQTFGGSNSALPALMDCMVLQNGVLLKTNEQLTSGRPMSIEIDWDNPPKAGRNWRALKARKEQDRQKRLGISSFSGLYSFIYITDYEVRHEILIPLLTFERWLSIERKDTSFISVEEQTAAEGKIAGFFRSQAPVDIDGRRVKPILRRLNFYGLDIRDFARNAKPRRISVHQARLGVILAYPSRQRLRKVDLRWNLFDKHATFLRSVVLIHDQKPGSHTFVKERPEFTWQEKDPRPRTTITPVARQAGKRISEEVAKGVAAQLLTNVYAAFQFQDEGQTYDALATSTDGNVLRQVYLQVRRALLMSEQGGARSRVSSVSLTDGQLLPGNTADQFQLKCRWRVKGIVEHWGHLHQRENEYHATLSIKTVDNRWKLAGYDVRQLRRVNFQTTLRQ